MSCLCDQCAALCCRYFALPLDNPRTAREYDDIRWYLIHENVVVFIEARQWYIGIMSRCKHLQADNRCGIYETRPKICREYSTENCDYHGGEYDFEKLFTSAEQLEDYAREKLAAARKRKRLSGKVSPPARPKRPTRRRLSIAAGALSLGKGAVNGSGNGNGKGNGRRVSLPQL
jgi:Fe-S-cluster containining protein